MEKINFKNKGEPGAIPANADNLNLMQNNVENSFKSNKTTSDKDTYSCNYINGIIESGSNSNGNWIKFSDGTMICYGTGKGKNDTTNIVTFAVPFINNEYKVSSFIVSTDEHYIRTVQIKEKTAATMEIYLQWFQMGTTSAGLGADTFDYIAIGRWK